MDQQGARFQIHFEKIKNFVDGNGASPFEARLAIVNAEGSETLFWINAGNTMVGKDQVRLEPGLLGLVPLNLKSKASIANASR